MSGVHPEPLLLKSLDLDRSLLEPGAVKAIEHLIQFGECGLAYDIFIFEMDGKEYQPSRAALELIKQAAEALGVKYPKLSTDR